MQKILSIGDVHGRDRWMFHTHGSPYEFTYWKVAVENGAPGDNEFWNDMPYMKYDKIIFVGDYCDSFDLSNETILKNLQEIIFFKKAVPNRVILLLGNHEMQYIVRNQICTGHRSEMSHVLFELLNDKECEFKIAHQEIGENNKTYIWTHAGITQGWLDNVKKEVFKEKYRLYKVIIDYKDASITDFINMLWEIRNDRIYSADRDSSGWDVWASPIWVRPYMLNKYPLDGINQIVGHTPKNSINKKEFEGFTHYFIDCLFDDVDEALILEI